MTAPAAGETYRVRPGSVTAVRVTGGDRLTVVDSCGRQQAELTVLARDPGVIDVRPDAPATVLRGLVAGPDEVGYAAAALLRLLAEYRVPQREAMAAQLFGEWSAAGAQQSFAATGDGVVLVAAPAVAMRVDQSNPPSDLVVRLERGQVRGPDPVEPAAALVEPLLDMRVEAATAFAYPVRAGQYIQIMDIAGRQCSDFLAFDARGLQDGVEYALDATTTRTRTARAYPRPGLFGKFYDAEGRPLVEVVRDTVGRHDTFGLACNAQYYADMGYPGHVNCTDNFNAELADYGVAPRAGWPALNLFYNTAFGSDHQLVVDEPWSRPGDYVLLRALTDLVCASSACPDDIDPANGWLPTDVQVRVYDSKRTFAVAMASRVTPDADLVLTKSTGFAARTGALTRQQREYRGYWLPESYDNYGAQGEYWACRERVAVMDLSPLRKFEILGPEAELLLQSTLTRDIRKLSRGQVGYSAMCHETGGMIDDCTVFRLGEDNFRFVGGDDYDGLWLREQAARLGLDRVWIKKSTDQLHNLAVQGPRSRELMAGIIWTPPTQPAFAELGWFRFVICRLGGPDGLPLLVSRTGYTGELGYELWVHPSDAGALWDAVWQAGEQYGLAPLGLAALDMLRIEAGLAFAGYEYTDQTDPFEAGIGFTVTPGKSDDYVGRGALIERRQHPQRTLVGLELAGCEPAEHGDCVHVGRTRVGVVTSATRSPILGKNIALCRIAVQHAAAGTAVEVGKLDGHRKRVAANVVRFPFYDPDKTRPRS